jgi:hypothetical protein
MARTIGEDIKRWRRYRDKTFGFVRCRTGDDSLFKDRQGLRFVIPPQVVTHLEAI